MDSIYIARLSLQPLQNQSSLETRVQDSRGYRKSRPKKGQHTIRMETEAYPFNIAKTLANLRSRTIVK